MNRTLITALKVIANKYDEFPEPDKEIPEGVSNNTLKWLWGWLNGSDRRNPPTEVVKDIEKHFIAPTTSITAYRGLHLKKGELDSYASLKELKSSRYSSWSKDLEEAKAFAFKEGDENHPEGIVFKTTLRPNDILFDVEEFLGEHWDMSLEKELIVKPGTYKVENLNNTLIAALKRIVTSDLASHFRKTFNDDQFFVTWDELVKQGDPDVDDYNPDSDEILDKLGIEEDIDIYDMDAFEEASTPILKQKLDKFIKAFNQKATKENGKLKIWRCVSDDPDALIEQIESYEKSRYAVDLYGGIGVFWSWDKETANCHWGDASKGIVIEALVDPKAIDYTRTLAKNLHPFWDIEQEITLKPDHNLKVLKIYDGDKVIWEGDSAVIAALKKVVANSPLTTTQPQARK